MDVVDGTPLGRFCGTTPRRNYSASVAVHNSSRWGRLAGPPRLVVVRGATANLAKLGDDLVDRRLDLLASALLNLKWPASVELEPGAGVALAHDEPVALRPLRLPGPDAQD